MQCVTRSVWYGQLHIGFITPTRSAEAGCLMRELQSIRFASVLLSLSAERAAPGTPAMHMLHMCRHMQAGATLVLCKFIAG